VKESKNCDSLEFRHTMSLDMVFQDQKHQQAPLKENEKRSLKMRT
jgi:hypothetical protein